MDMDSKWSSSISESPHSWPGSERVEFTWAHPCGEKLPNDSWGSSLVNLGWVKSRVIRMEFRSDDVGGP